MTTEEIEKAAGEYSGEELTSGYPYVHPAHRQFIEKRHEAFKAGAEFADKHWQEKTRWIPIEERLPEIKDNPFYIAVKFLTGDITAWIVFNQGDINRLKAENGSAPIYTHWKEIE